LHVSIATSLHQSFLWLRPLQARFTVFRVLTAVLKLDSFTPPVTQKLIQIGRRCRQALLAPRAFPPFTFISRRFFVFSALSYRRHSHARQTPWSVLQDGSIRPLLCQCILSTQLILAPQESFATTVLTMSLSRNNARLLLSDEREKQPKKHWLKATTTRCKKKLSNGRERRNPK